MLAAPIPTISWSGSTSSPRARREADAVAIVSVSDDERDARAPATSSGTTSRRLGPREARRREALRAARRPCATPWSARSSTADDRGRADDGDQDGRDAAASIARAARSSDGEHAEADEQRRSRSPGRGPRRTPDLVEEAVGVGREPEELRQLADDDRQGQAVHVADLDLASRAGRRRSRASRRPSPISITPDQQREHPGQRDRARRVARRAEQRERSSRRSAARPTSPGRARGPATARTRA